MMQNTIPEEKIKGYLELTKKALKKARIIAPKKSYAHKVAEDFMTMAQSYYSDAVHFFESGDYVNAFACVNYSHGWIDAGARLGLFDVGGDDRLFTLAE